MKRLKIYIHSQHTMDNATKIYTGEKAVPGVALTLVIDPIEARRLIDDLIDGISSAGTHPRAFELHLQGTIAEESE